MTDIRDKIVKALAKPMPMHFRDIGELEPDTAEPKFFDPWSDVVSGIYGHYSQDCDNLMIEAMIAIRDQKCGELMDIWGFSGEFALYVLAGHELTDYGTSPRFPWPDRHIADLWDRLIEKWSDYRAVAWKDDD